MVAEGAHPHVLPALSAGHCACIPISSRGVSTAHLAVEICRDLKPDWWGWVVVVVEEEFSNKDGCKVDDDDEEEEEEEEEEERGGSLKIIFLVPTYPLQVP